MKGLNKALFLDLDGTIIKTKSGETFSKDINDWEFISGVLPSIKRFSDQGYVICIVSNQGGIELGHVTEEFITTKLNTIRSEIEQYIGQAINVGYCPVMEHYDRKPNPGMAYYFARALYLDLRQSIMVGDMESDHAFQVNAGIGAYLNINQFVDTISSLTPQK